MNMLGMMGELMFLGSKIIDFKEKGVFFAINNTCNCRCQMCSIWKSKDKKITSLKEAKKALGILYENDFCSVQLTGGEPFLNPNILEIIKHAKKLRYVVLIPSNGTLITENIADKLSKYNVDQISISLHHHNPEILERIQGHKNIYPKVLKSIETLKEKKVPVSALCTLSKYNINDIEKVVNLTDDLGIGISFSVPICKTETSYSLGGSCVDIRSSELKNAILHIIKLKKKGHNIINNMTYLKDIAFCLENKSRYFCYGGSKLFYLDWNLKIYPCMFKGKGVEITKASFDGEETCNGCLMQCFREPSVFLKSRREAVRVVIKDYKYYLNMLKKEAKIMS